eukprot:gene9830-13259_t
MRERSVIPFCRPAATHHPSARRRAATGAAKSRLPSGPRTHRRFAIARRAVRTPRNCYPDATNCRYCFTPTTEPTAVTLVPVIDQSYPISNACGPWKTPENMPLAPVLLCHSMGGLAVRAWLRAHQADGRVHRVLTLGTPHGGTWLGRFSHAPPWRQMRM